MGRKVGARAEVHVTPRARRLFTAAADEPSGSKCDVADGKDADDDQQREHQGVGLAVGIYEAAGGRATADQVAIGGGGLPGRRTCY